MKLVDKTGDNVVNMKQTITLNQKGGKGGRRLTIIFKIKL